MERQEGQKMSESEQLAQELMDYFKECKFGDVKYQAYWDLKNIEELGYDAYDLAKKGNKRDSIEESKLRYLENRKALLDQSIEQKKITVPGYWSAYIGIWGRFEDYGVTLNRESEKLNISEDARRDWFKDRYDDTEDKIETFLQEELTWVKDS